MSSPPVAARRRGSPRSASAELVTLEVVAVEFDGGTIAIAYAVDPSGMHAAVAVEPLTGEAIRRDLVAGRQPSIDVEAWSLLPGFPWPGYLR